MKNLSIGLLVGSSLFFSFSNTLNAQVLKGIGKKIGQKVESYVDKTLDENLKPTSNRNSSSNGNNQEGPFENLKGMKNDFARGAENIFEDNFSQDSAGDMASRWTSNGRGEVSKVSIADGNWLQLFDGNTYKIKQLVRIPENFTIEFDVLAMSDQEPKFALDFGFDYQKGVGNHYYLAYQNPLNIQASYWFNKFDFASKEVDPNKRSEVKANMSYFVNDMMKVKIRVDGERMRTYINEYKILDTEMANPASKKYFYFAFNSDDKSAEVYIGNFRIDKI
ncbi:hypothetical protein [Sphingobacterium bovistauri]|uniref:Uncharacterized protein n=1 Tax=Sphingobacterium bovistauri TaxID=2781959 RepID=A0ABS7Z0L0_9SPHI|nr:hypothetical protein [Sphingobacterium bovistauri]MCA5003703.1 hypothetical protein [Sphingobacterium bovistauri]